MLSRIDTSEREPAYVLRGANGGYIKLSASAHFLLTQIDAGATADELAERLSRDLGRVVTADEVRAAHAQVSRQVAAIEGRTQRPSTAGLWFRVRCLPRPAIDWLSRRLSFALHPVVVLPLAVTMIFAALRAAGDISTRHRAMMDPGSLFFPVFALFVLSMLMHELGHATACARYGVSARDIGFGLYLIFPVAYSDVSAAWTLTRRQRVAVDLAGVYFQLLVGLAYLTAYRLGGWEVFHLASVLVFAVAPFVLMPIFKLDGYWFLADLLGVPNLYRQVPRVFHHIRDRVRRRSTAALPWPSWVSIAVLVYGAFSVAFLALFGVRLAMTFGSLAASYPARVAGLVRDLSLPPHRLASGRLHTIIGPTYILLGVGWALARIVRRSARALWSRGAR